MVDMDDVERVVRRDYPPSSVPDILCQITATDVREKARVVLACLKVASGDRRRLEGVLQDAPGYYREILSEAEYPLATKRWSRMQELSDEERSSVYEHDWKQYIAWLGRAALPSAE
jgi:hypothetical protein